MDKTIIIIIIIIIKHHLYTKKYYSVLSIRFLLLFPGISIIVTAVDVIKSFIFLNSDFAEDLSAVSCKHSNV